LARCKWSLIVAGIVTSLVLGCGGGEPVGPNDNGAVIKPKPGMEDAKEQAQKAIKNKKSKRAPANVPLNLRK
jgi:hypothetical protein